MVMAETIVSSSPVKNDNSRKNKKPLMEKKRRARINTCLTELKGLVLQAVKKDSSQYSKLEKADILEMTVTHLRTLQRQQAVGVMTQDTHVISKYRAGFNECANEVVRYMGSVHELNDDVKQSLMGHLADCLQVVNQVSHVQSMRQQQQHVNPIHFRIAPQQTIGMGILMHSAPAPRFQTGLDFTLSARPAASDCSVSSHVTVKPVTTLPVQNLSAVATTVSALATPMSGAFKIVSSGAGGKMGVPVAGSSSSPPCSVDTVSARPRCPLSPSAQPHGTVSSLVTSPSTSPKTPVSDVPSATESSSHLAQSAKTAPAFLSTELKQIFGTQVAEAPSSSSQHRSNSAPSSLADDKLWRPW